MKVKFKCIMECSLDKNTIYYLTEEEYKIYNFSYNQWDRYLLGKFTTDKCIKLLKSAYKKYKINLFQNVKTKIIKNTAKLKGKKSDIIFAEYAYEC